METKVYISVEGQNQHLVLDGPLSLLGRLLDTFRGPDVREREHEERQHHHEGQQSQGVRDAG